jgi:hypothetical protein
LALAAFSVSLSYKMSVRIFGQKISNSLLTHRTAQTQSKRSYTSMLRVGFKATTPAFVPAKTVHTFDSGIQPFFFFCSRTPNVITLLLFSPEVVGVYFKLYTVHNLHIK